MTSAPQTVIFDLGAVLIDWDPRHMYRKLIGDEATMEEFLAEIATLRWNSYHDAGRSWDDGVAMLSAVYPEYAELIASYRDRWDEMLNGPIDGSVEILAELKEQGREVHALTNWSAETFPIARERFEFLNWFGHIVVSGDEKVKKPDPRIYHILLDRIDREASDCVFIDDSLANVRAAVDLGMVAIHFTGPQQLREELVALGLLG